MSLTASCFETELERRLKHVDHDDRDIQVPGLERLDPKSLWDSTLDGKHRTI